jgi:iron complex outermembrane recepter protein
MAVASAVTVLRSATAFAQSAAAPDAAASSPPTQSITVTATRARGYMPTETSALGVPLPAQQLPATVNSIGAEFLNDFNIKGLNGLANYIPGVTLDDNGGETGENLLIRGFSSSTVFIDGLRSRARYGVPRSLPDVLERVEITKGPAGAEVGVAEFGGSVNLVTKKPRRERAAEASAAFGDFGYRKLGVDVSGALVGSGAVQGRLIAAAEQNAEWRKGRPDTWRYVFAPSLNWDYADNSSLLVQYERYVQEAPLDRGIVYLEGAFPGSNFAPRDWSFHQTSDRNRRAFDRLSLDWKHALGDNVSARARVQQYRERRHLREFSNADTEPGDGEPNDLYNDDGRSWNGNRSIAIFYSDWRENYQTRNAVAQLTGTFTAIGGTHTLRGGAEQYRFKILPGSAFADLSNDNSIDILALRNHQTPDNLTVSGSPSIDQGSTQQTSLYATWLGQWTPQWRTVLGLRRDRFREAVQSRVDGAVDFGFASQSDTNSWRVSSSYDIVPEVTAFIGLSNAFQPQSGITRSGQALLPSGGRSAEAGLKASLFGGRALWTNAVYQITQSGISGCDTDPSLDEEDIEQCRFSVLFGSARVRGFESELQGALTPELQLSAGIALMQSRITQTQGVYVADAARAGQTFVGNRFANTPKLQASAALTYSWRSWGLPQLRTSLGAVHVGRRFGNPGNTIVLPAYTVIDAGARWQLTPQTTLSLNVGNVLDETYYTAMQASDDRADQVGVGERRLVQLKLSHAF